MFERERVFMPTPQQLGRGDRMGRGPYEKSGLLADTSLPPRRTSFRTDATGRAGSSPRPAIY